MDNKKILVFDSSILLGMYEYSHDVVKKILTKLEEIEDQIWIPNQTYLEFKKNRKNKKMKEQAIGQYGEAIKNLNNILQKNHKNLEVHIKNYKKRYFPEIREFEELINQNFETNNDLIKNYGKVLKMYGEENKELHKTDPINSLIDRLNDYDQIGKEYSISNLFQIYEEAEKRYTYKLPPGYMDDKRYNPKEGKDAPEKFGDYLIWKQIIEISFETEKSVLFITNDQKEDWLIDKELRKDLIEEFKEKTEGQSIKRLGFKELISEKLNIQLDPSLKLELFPQDYIDESPIKETISYFLSDDNTEIEKYLANISDEKLGLEFEEVKIEEEEIDIDLNLDEIICIEKYEDYIVYQLTGNSNFNCLINNFYEIVLNVSFEITLSFDLEKDNGSFILENMEIVFDKVICNNYETADYKDICPICLKNEGIQPYETGEYICESCSDYLTFCTGCGTYFENDSSKLATHDCCVKCFEYEGY